MKNYHKLGFIAFIFLIATLACSMPGSLNPVSSVQTMIPAEAQTLVATILPPEVTALAGIGGLLNGNCQNDLYPVVPGATWDYTMSGPLPGTFVRSITGVSDEGFTEQDVFSSGTIRTGLWSCDSGTLTSLSPGGGIKNTGNVQFSGVSADFQTTASDGITLPADINTGSSWSQNVTLEGIQNLNGQEIPSKSQSSYNCTAVEYESITVPAGTFDTIRIDCEVEIAITITMAGIEIPSTIHSTNSAWQAAGVGMVRSLADLGDGVISTTELTAFNIP